MSSASRIRSAISAALTEALKRTEDLQRVEQAGLLKHLIEMALMEATDQIPDKLSKR